MLNKKILKIINYIISATLILFVGIVLSQRLSNNKISFFNYRIFAVVTGSMEPKYKIGDVIISKNVPAEKIKVGQTISYIGERSSLKGRVITHQVTKKYQDEDGNYVFRARGLANIAEDPLIQEDQIYGVVVYKCLIVSFIYKVVTKPIGFFLFIVVPLFILVGSNILRFLLNKEANRRNI